MNSKPTSFGTPQSRAAATLWERLILELPGVSLVLLAVAFHAYFLAPHLHVGSVPMSDSALHLAASERLAESFKRGEPFLDPWVSEWSLGYPLWRSYQPLLHILASICFFFTDGWLDHGQAFAALQFSLLVLLPLTTYFGARLLGLVPLAAGIAALLVGAPSELGEFGRFGLGYGAHVWWGSGLDTQLLSLHMLVLSIGLLARALDSGEYRALAALFLAATAASHIIFGYVAFVSAAIIAVTAERRQISQTLVRLVTVAVPALALLAWFVVPLMLAKAEVNHCRWEPAFKWDSFGAGPILKQLCSGNLLDANRFPILTGFLGLSSLIAALAIRETLPRRLLILSLTWLLLFFGRPTWGLLLNLALVPGDLHLHRLQGAFELFAVLLAAWGVDRALSVCELRGGRRAVVIAGFFGAGLLIIGKERAEFLRTNYAQGEASFKEYNKERPQLAKALGDLERLLAERPGRVSAGRAATWGRNFKIGLTHMYAFLSRAHLDQVSFLYHSMSLTSDVMEARNEQDPRHDALFGVRGVIAPVDLEMPRHLRRVATHGRFAVYEASKEGYFGLVDVCARFSPPRKELFDLTVAWLRSSSFRDGGTIALSGGDTLQLPVLIDAKSITAVPQEKRSARGRIVSEVKSEETYSAQVELARDCDVLIKITWHPDLRARVDGQVTSIMKVVPGFGAIRVPAGRHEVIVTYEPGRIKVVLLVIGLVILGGVAGLLRNRSYLQFERRVIGHAEQLLALVVSNRALLILLLLVSALLSLRPLFQGKFIDGHDTMAYCPRLPEYIAGMKGAGGLPIWAPDLATGHGEPLFAFSPPLVIWAAIPLYTLGLSIANSYQLGLALLGILSLSCVYLTCRLLQLSKFEAAAGAVLWMWSPYLHVDLYVRAAFAESAALAISPVALFLLLRAMDQATLLPIVLAGFGVFLVILGHNAVALFVIPLLALMVVVRAIVTNSRAALLSGGMALIIGVLLSAFFWAPALLEKEFTHADRLRHLPWSCQDHAVSAVQLFWSQWGHGISVKGPHDGMSFSLGALHISLALLGAVLLLSERSNKLRGDLACLALGSVAGAWLATEWGTVAFEKVTLLQYLQFPWRSLALPTICLPILGAYAVSRIPRRVGIALLMLVTVSGMLRTEPRGYVELNEQAFSPQAISKNGALTTTYNEYWPIAAELQLPPRADGLRGWSTPVESKNIERSSTTQEYELVANARTLVESATAYFPGWTVTIDGQRAPALKMPLSGTIAFHVEPGAHRVKLELLPTTVRLAARLVSVSALMFVLIICCAASVGHAVDASALSRLGRNDTLLAVGLVLSMNFIALSTIRHVDPTTVRSEAPVEGVTPDQVLMKLGLQSLYEERDPGGAVALLTELIRRYPAHYGGRYQLALALDKAGKRREARPHWEEMRRKAMTANDKATLESVTLRLKTNP